MPAINMPDNTASVPRLIDVYPYLLVRGEPHYLLLHRSKDVVYSGQWRMVGGKVQTGESAVDAAMREFREETSQRPKSAWVIPTVNAYYDPLADQIRYIPAFAFECETDVVQLNHEHDYYNWFTINDAVQQLLWYEQKRILQLVHDILTSNSVLTEWHLTV
jgi:dihydroneopterin triphosphate diphosphatase